MLSNIKEKGRYKKDKYQDVTDLTSELVFFETHPLKQASHPFIQTIKTIFQSYTEAIYNSYMFNNYTFRQFIDPQTWMKTQQLINAFRAVFQKNHEEFKAILFEDIEMIRIQRWAIQKLPNLNQLVNICVDDLTQQFFRRAELLANWMVLICYQSIWSNKLQGLDKVKYHTHSQHLKSSGEQVLFKSMKDLHVLLENYLYILSHNSKQGDWLDKSYLLKEVRSYYVETPEQIIIAQSKIKELEKQIQNNQRLQNILKASQMLFRRANGNRRIQRTQRIQRISRIQSTLYKNNFKKAFQIVTMLQNDYSLLVMRSKSLGQAIDILKNNIKHSS